MWESDEWRGKDSFDTFREVFEKAKLSKVDMVLLGGDLFHENKPSRNTLVNCLQILNEHCLGNEPIRFEVRRHQLQADILARMRSFVASVFVTAKRMLPPSPTTLSWMCSSVDTLYKLSSRACPPSTEVALRRQGAR